MNKFESQEDLLADGVYIYFVCASVNELHFLSPACDLVLLILSSKRSCQIK